MPAKTDEKVVKEIIKRYGDTLDLRRSPYLIIEILRQYGGRIDGVGAADCLPPGGPPPKKFDPGQIIREFNARLSELARLSSLLDGVVNAPARRGGAKRAPAKRTTAKRAVAKRATAKRGTAGTAERPATKRAVARKTSSR